MINIAVESQAGIGNHFHTTRETAVGHEILHDLNGIDIFDIDPGDLVERHCIPKADQADAFAGIVVKQNGFGSLPTANQCGIGRKFAEEVRLASATWA